MQPQACKLYYEARSSGLMSRELADQLALIVDCGQLCSSSHATLDKTCDAQLLVFQLLVRWQQHSEAAINKQASLNSSILASYIFAFQHSNLSFKLDSLDILKLADNSVTAYSKATSLDKQIEALNLLSFELRTSNFATISESVIFAGASPSDFVLTRAQNQNASQVSNQNYQRRQTSAQTALGADVQERSYLSSKANVQEPSFADANNMQRNSRAKVASKQHFWLLASLAFSSLFVVFCALLVAMAKGRKRTLPVDTMQSDGQATDKPRLDLQFEPQSRVEFLTSCCDGDDDDIKVDCSKPEVLAFGELPVGSQLFPLDASLTKATYCEPSNGSSSGSCTGTRQFNCGIEMLARPATWRATPSCEWQSSVSSASTLSAAASLQSAQLTRQQQLMLATCLRHQGVYVPVSLSPMHGATNTSVDATASDLIITPCTSSSFLNHSTSASQAPNCVQASRSSNLEENFELSSPGESFSNCNCDSAIAVSQSIARPKERKVAFVDCVAATRQNYDD